MSRSRSPSITFFFPYREVSGVPVLFLRMAEYLASNSGMETYVVDFADGYMSRSADPNSGVKVRRFEEGVPIDIPSDTILVMQSVLPYTMRPELRISAETRIIFWTLYPMNLVQTILPLPSFRRLQSRSLFFHRLGMRLLFPTQRRLLRDLVNSLHAKKSLWFMDGPTLKSTAEYVQAAIPYPVFIPVPSDDAVSNAKLGRSPRSKDRLDVCWVGRLADFKIHILVYTIKKLREWGEQRRLPVTVHVVGDGPEARRLDRFEANEPYFQMRRVGPLGKKELDAFLVESADVVAAMGTSALEGARLGIPTLLLDISYGPVAEGYKFKWLFEAKEWSLGDIVDAGRFEPGDDSLNQRLDSLLGDYESLSRQTFGYYTTHHAIKTVCEKFLTAVDRASFAYADFDPAVFSKGFLRRSYETIRAKRVP